MTAGEPLDCNQCTKYMQFMPKPYREVTPKTVYQSQPQQIVTYPYPPMVQLPNGTWYETPDIVTLVKLVYDLRNRVHELENEEKECVSRSMKY